MKFNQLRALVTISESGSIHEASRHLHITQPALTKAIQELEASVGATLLERSSTGTRLTPYGHRLVPIGAPGRTVTSVTLGISHHF